MLLFSTLLASCAGPNISSTPTAIQPTETEIVLEEQTPALSPTSTALPTVTPAPLIPQFEHIVLIVFENEDFESVIGNDSMPVFNRLAQESTLLTQYYAVTHPSLPNYIALISGDTFGINSNCHDCYIDSTSLPDLIETSGRTWKTFQEDMPEPCFVDDTDLYARKHNPFVYFDAIRLNRNRCEQNVVPLTELNADIESAQLANFIFITPNLCNDAHDCSLDAADKWLENLLATLVPALDESNQPYLVILTFDEGDGDSSCCGLPEDDAGGRVPVVLISPSVKNAFEDNTSYTHYSLLKTISESWGLTYLGHAADENNVLIMAPWK
jgi:hypothetical protein